MRVYVRQVFLKTLGSVVTRIKTKDISGPRSPISRHTSVSNKTMFMFDRNFVESDADR